MKINRIRLTENFYLDEFVDPVTFFTMVDHGLSMIDMRVVKIVQLLRKYHGSSIGVNGWWKYYLQEPDENFNPEKFEDKMEKQKTPIWSGYRSDRCPIGAKLSAHKLKKAADPKGDEKAFFKIVCDHAQEFYDLGLRRIEDVEITNGWLHVDIEERGHVAGRIRVINLSDHVADIIVATGEYKLAA